MSGGRIVVHAIQLPLRKGNGAICRTGEKFAANPMTRAGAVTVPIATSPARSGCIPRGSLTCDSIRRSTICKQRGIS